MKKRWLALLLAGMMLLAAAMPAVMAEETEQICILFTHDMHSHLNGFETLRNGETMELVRARSREGRMPAGIMHCFTGSWECAKVYLDMGMYISLSGAVTFKNAPKLAEVAQNVPADRLHEDRSQWDYRYAVELIRDLKESGADFCIGGACYPEIHPESANQKEDILRLKEKVDAGCEFLTTQMFFDNNLLYNFLYKIREAGITVPVIPGIMPITNANQVERAVKLSGSFIPQRFKSLVDKFGSDPASMKQAGIAYATDQIIDLYANNVTHVHVYSMNKPDVAEKIQSNLSEILGK